MNPIHRNQHGFQKGKSTETAISKTVNVIENHMNQVKYCIELFLDIQGAFDTISPTHIKDTLLEPVSYTHLTLPTIYSV